MVYGLVSQLGGGLEIHSQLGLGTNLELLLPRGNPRAIDGQQAPKLSTATDTRGTALMVDDEEFVRMSTAAMLNDLG